MFVTLWSGTLNCVSLIAYDVVYLSMQACSSYCR
uniref:Uncharacterized protein n=1 Tax=Arundo donax TaxID=35708 RepID=A0A0A9DZN3_ARUDO